MPVMPDLIRHLSFQNLKASLRMGTPLVTTFKGLAVERRVPTMVLSGGFTPPRAAW
jgi:hypothetical protein